MSRQRMSSRVLRTSTLASVALTLVLLVAFPTISRTSPGQPEDRGAPTVEKTSPSEAMLRMILRSQSNAQDFVRNQGCEPPVLDQSKLNRLILMGYLERVIVAEGGFSDILLSYPNRDRDGDGFTARPKRAGATFRGKDCDDRDSETHPMLGGLSQPAGIEHDYNCNGIFGIDPDTGFTFENEYCRSFWGDRGLLVFGDSWASGFGLDAACLDGRFKQCMTPGVDTIFNYPEASHLSGYTGPSSFYLEMYRMNRCAHRQWMNFATPGAKMEDFIHQVDRLDLTPGKPSVVVVQFASGDVCADTVENMTTPEDFETQLTNALDELDIRIGNASRVLLMGVSSGAQYNLMSDQLHPLTTSTGNATYSNVYDYLDCVGLNPCPTYLNNDPTVRSAAVQRANELDQILMYVTQSETYPSFDIVYVDTDEVINDAIWEMNKKGIPSYEFFNEFDGFHPSLEFSSFAGNATINILQTRYPEILGAENPNNWEIVSQFGDQGGY